MRAPLSDRGALLGDFGVSLGAALGGRPRRARIDMLGRNRWPSAGATLDLDFVAQQGYAFGQGIGRIQDLVTISGGAGGTVVGPNGLIVAANAPRFDYDPVTLACRGLLIEEQRTNRATYSEDFTGYTNGGTQVTANQGTAPDGTNTADLISAATTDIYKVLWEAHGGATCCLSMFVKATTAPYFMLSFGAPNTQRVVFNLSNGSVASTVGSITGSSAPWSNGWFRLVVVGVPVTANAYNQFNAYASTTYADRTTGALVWGAQLEAGSFAASYIPTTSAAVTRTADIAVISGAKFLDWYSPSGTLVFEATHPASGIRTPVQIGSDISNRFGPYWSTAALNYFDGGFSTLASGVAAGNHKIALTLAANDIAGSLDGALAVNAAGRTIKAGVNMLSIGQAVMGSEQLCGRIRRLRYYPRRLSNAELQELTR